MPHPQITEDIRSQALALIEAGNAFLAEKIYKEAISSYIEAEKLIKEIEEIDFDDQLLLLDLAYTIGALYELEAYPLLAFNYYFCAQDQWLRCEPVSHDDLELLNQKIKLIRQSLTNTNDKVKIMLSIFAESTNFFKEEKVKLSKELEEIKNLLAQSNNYNADLRAEIERLKLEKTALNQALSEAHESVIKTSELNQISQSIISELEKEKNAIFKKQDETQKKLAQTEQYNATLEEKLINVQEELTLSREMLSSSEREVSELEAENLNLNEKCFKQKDTITQKTKYVSTLKQEIASLQKEVDDTRLYCESQRDSLSLHAGEMIHKENLIESLKEEVISLREQVGNKRAHSPFWEESLSKRPALTPEITDIDDEAAAAVIAELSPTGFEWFQS